MLACELRYPAVWRLFIINVISLLLHIRWTKPDSISADRL